MELTNEDSGCDVVGRAPIQDNDLLDAYIALRQDVPSVVSSEQKTRRFLFSTRQPLKRHSTL